MKKLFSFLTATLITANVFGQTVWSEDFEGSQNWYATGGTWEIGIPTSGPDTAFTGVKCAATVLAGNYNDGVDSRLVQINPITIPAANLKPRLRFWHWFSFEYGDWGRVQISTDGVNWTDVTTYYYYNTCSNAWTVEEIDLTTWAGMNVRFAFQFHSQSPYTSYGWYIDDLEIRTGQYSFLNPEGFETGYGDWSVERGTWKIGQPTSGPAAAHTGANCAGTHLNGIYDDAVDTRLRTTWYTIPAANLKPRLRFWHWFSFEYGDWGRVQISTDGVNWTDVTNYYYYNTCSNAWTVEEIDLTTWAGMNVRFAFQFHSQFPYTSYGWYIDDLEIRTGQYSFLNPEGFETGYGDWSVERGTWEIGQPTSGPAAAHTGANCAGTHLNGIYDDAVDTRLRTTWFIVPSASLNPGLSFWHWFSFEYGDYGNIQVRTPSSNWVTITQNNFTSVSTPWTFYYQSLITYADSTVQIAFTFHSQSPYTSSGWYIDDINIIGLSSVTLIETNANSPFDSIKIYPNPFIDKIFLEIKVKKDSDVTIKLSDIIGRTVYFQKVNLTAGHNALQLNTSATSSGVYLLELSANGIVSRRKIYGIRGE